MESPRGHEVTEPQILSLGAFVRGRAATVLDACDLAAKLRATAKRRKIRLKRTKLPHPGSIVTCYWFGNVRVVLQYNMGLTKLGEGTDMRADALVAP